MYHKFLISIRIKGDTMNFTFTCVTADNIEIFKQLQVAHNQLDTIETVLECFEEAQECDLWNPLAIACDGEYVGFTMYGEFINPYRVWFDRFFIDERYQNKGYGKAIITVILEEIAKKYTCKEIHLSVYPHNIPAINLYKQVGFTFTGELDTKGEHVMVLTV